MWTHRPRRNFFKLTFVVLERFFDGVEGKVVGMHYTFIAAFEWIPEKNNLQCVHHIVIWYKKELWRGMPLINWEHNFHQSMKETFYQFHNN